MNIWFSSDWHLGHSNITGPQISTWDKGYRDFNSVQEMNYHIITNINKFVAQDDIIYFLGDFCFGGHVGTPEYRQRITCKNIHFIKGNHDNHIDLYKDCFTSVQDVLDIKHGQHSFFLSHYKHAIWKASHKGNIHLYGHSHASAEKWVIGKSMDVGIDNAKRILNEYRPFNITEIIAIMSKREIDFVDHHNSKTNI